MELTVQFRGVEMRLNFELYPPKYRAKCDFPNIRIGALGLFKRGHCNGEIDGRWIILSWHRYGSITWRWFLDWAPARYGALTYKWIGPNGHGKISIGLWKLGSISFHWQPHMWKHNG